MNPTARFVSSSDNSMSLGFYTRTNITWARCDIVNLARATHNLCSKLSGV